ncbi:PEP-CTERM sorting domain-containing protein [Actomonas aquatica]|uniref:PEP-CTERM sorting domain-containing protein n=1 Tax=Actomonas aquatica TaxID=2866162 RepID=A0ABZ1C5H3_9BACT|nr:PEP-CTERM sorting domain-containing protein [Opitutus sp. WL0086]WRQ86983.1 PEP-CTERM sorting domain-containing protein [Opitutus sp. WL0086]
MITLRSLLLLACTCALSSVATAQTSVFSYTFESDNPDNDPSVLPDGWTISNSPNAFVVSNAFTTGNSSTRVLQFSSGTSNASIFSTAHDLSSFTGNETFTLSFDYYQSSGTDSSLLIGFTDSTSGVGFEWVGIDSQTTGIGPLRSLFSPATQLFNFDPTSAGQWYHFEFDVSAYIQPYIDYGEAPSTDFRIAFQNYASAAGGGSQEIYLDNLSLSAVPEPSTYAALLGAAFLAYAVARRRSPIRRSPQA